MKLYKKLILSIAALGLTTAVFADDWDDYSEETEEPTVTVSGKVEMNARAYVDQRDAKDDRLDVDEWKTDVFPSGKVNVNYSGLSSDVSMTLKFDKNSLANGYYWDILDEFTARAYVGNAQFEAGKMRVVWGKGDKIHVLDNFNANDYTDYIVPDYIDRRISEPMLRAVYSTNNNVKFEAIYTPMMTVDRLGTGVWEPKAAAALQGNVKTLAMAAYAETVNGAEKARIFAAETAALKALMDAGNTEASTEMTKRVTDYIKNQNLDAITAKIMGGASATDAFNAVVGEVYGEKIHELVTNKGLPPATATSLVLASEYSDYVQTTLSNAVTAQNLALTNLSGLSNDSSFLYPDTMQLKYGQAGARMTFTVGGADLGVSYYYGHLKQPSFNAEKFTKAMATYLATGNMAESDKFLAYDRVQIFGLEGAGILFGRLNSRFEAAYNMTDDIAGDDPAVHNNSIGWVAGFDIDLPIHNINFNVQENGKYILGGDDIKKKPYDVDADANDCFTNNKLIVDITDTWNHEKIKLDLKGIWGIERGDLIVMPTLTFVIKDDFNLNLSGMYIWCKDSDSEFDGWERNSFAQIGVKYQF